jgi:hypothetical protein
VFAAETDKSGRTQYSKWNPKVNHGFFFYHIEIYTFNCYRPIRAMKIQRPAPSGKFFRPAGKSRMQRCTFRNQKCTAKMVFFQKNSSMYNFTVEYNVL